MRLFLYITFFVMLHLTSHSQPIASPTPPPQFYSNILTSSQSILDITKKWLDTNALAKTSKKWIVVPYMTYAPNGPAHVGGGLFCIYQVSDIIGMGIGIDYLGQLSMPSGQVSVKFPTQPLLKFGIPWTFTPFAFTGVAVPVLDKVNRFSTLAGSGLSIRMHKFTIFGKQAEAGVAGAAVRWMGTSEYSGTHYSIMPVLHVIL